MKEETKQELYVVFGPSGCGKTTLISKIISEYPERFCFSISHTTRKPRSNEVNGREYYFVSREEFNGMLSEGEFIETTNYAGNLYGTTMKMLDECVKANKTPILDVDIQGVKAFHWKHRENKLPFKCRIKYIFIKTSSLDLLEERLRKRMSNSQDEINRRMRSARVDVEWADLQDSFNYKIINDEFNSAYELFKQSFNLKT